MRFRCFRASKALKREGLVFDGNANTAFLEEGLDLCEAAQAASSNEERVGPGKKAKKGPPNGARRR